MALAAVNRLVHHSTIFEMNLESYRRCTAIQLKDCDRDKKTRASPKCRDTVLMLIVALASSRSTRHISASGLVAHTLISCLMPAVLPAGA